MVNLLLPQKVTFDCTIDAGRHSATVVAHNHTSKPETLYKWQLRFRDGGGHDVEPPDVSYPVGPDDQAVTVGANTSASISIGEGSLASTDWLRAASCDVFNYWDRPTF